MFGKFFGIFNQILIQLRNYGADQDEQKIVYSARGAAHSGKFLIGSRSDSSLHNSLSLFRFVSFIQPVASWLSQFLADS